MIFIKVRYKLKEGKREELLKFVHENVKKSRQESGNLFYEHFASIEDPNEMFVLEMWEAVENVDNHINEPHYIDFAEKRYPILEWYESQTYEISHLVRERSGAPRFDT